MCEVDTNINTGEKMGFQTGYNNIPEQRVGGGSSSNHAGFVRSFRMSKEQIGSDHVRRLLFLDGEDGMPLGLWLHHHYNRSTNRTVREVCLRRNGFNSTCPLCEYEYLHKKSNGETETRNWFPSYVGSYSVLMLGHPSRVEVDGKMRWQIEPIENLYKGKVYQNSYERHLLVLKQGNPQKKPGQLIKLADMVKAELGGDVPNFQGLVCDTYRGGELSESVGDNWKFVTYKDAPLRVPMDKFYDYVRKQGAPEDFDPELLKPFNHKEVWQPKPVDELRRILHEATGNTSVSGVGYGDNQAQEAAVGSVSGVGYNNVPNSGNVGCSDNGQRSFNDEDDSIPF